MTFRIYILFIFSLYLSATDAQSEFQKFYGGPQDDEGRSMQITNDGNLILAGVTDGSGAGNQDILVVKSDQDGNPIWSKTYGGSADDFPRAIIQTSDQGYAILGSTFSFGAGDEDVYLIKTDASGNVQWSKAYGGTAQERGFTILQTPDNGFIIGGSTETFTNGNYDAYILKTDANGNTEWTTAMGGGMGDSCFNIQIDYDGGYIFTGAQYSYGAGGVGFWLVKLSSAGVVLWAKTYGGSNQEHARIVRLTPDGGYLMIGHTNTWGAGGWDIILMKTDSGGNLEWSKVYGGSGNDFVGEVILTNDNGILLASYSESYGVGRDILLIKTDINGNIEWSKNYGFDGDDIMPFGSQNSIVQNGSGAYFLIGKAGIGQLGNSDMVLFKISENGNSSCNFNDVSPNIITVSPVTGDIDIPPDNNSNTAVAATQVGDPTILVEDYCTPPIADFFNNDTIICVGTCIDFIDESLNNPTNWEWSFPGGTPSASNSQNPQNICYNTPGTYEVQLIVSNSIGADTATQTIVVNDAPTATLSGSGFFCAEDSNPQVTLTVTFTGSGPWDLVYSYNGSPQAPITGINDNPYELIVSEAGNYALNSVENASCPGTVDGSSVVTSIDIELSVVPEDIACNGGNNGSIDLTVTGGNPQYLYQWSNNANTEDLSNLSAGTYSVTVSDTNGCSETISTSITEPSEALTAEIEISNPVNCYGGNDGTLDLSVQGGTQNYSYFWSNGSTLEDPSQLSADDYTVTITDANDCTFSVSITLTQPEAMVLNIELLQDVSCNNGNNGAVDLTVIGGVQPYSYSWSGVGGNQEDPDNLTAGNYNVIVTDANDCTVEGNISINEPSAILLIVNEINGVDCNNPNGGAADLTVEGGTPGYLYQWSNGSTEEDPFGLNAGAYTITVTDANDCSEIATVIITENTTPPTAIAITEGEINCDGNSAIINGSFSSGNGPISFEWLDNNGNTISTLSITSVDISGIYTLIVTDLSNGCTAETTATVDQENDIPVAVPKVSGILTCAVTTVTLDASNSTGIGTLAYQWLDSNNNVISDQISFDINTPGDFILIVSDLDNGCSAEELIVVDQNIIAPVADATTSGPLTCVQNTSTLDGSGSSGNGTITYEWFDDSNNSLGVNSTLDVNTPGDITLVVTDVDNGCTASIDITVDENTIAPDALAQVQETLTCSTVDVLVEGNGSSGNGTLEYDWQFGGNTISDNTDITVSEPGIYILIVTDTGNGCTDETQVEVMQDIAAPSAVATTSGLITCTSTTVTLDGGGSSGNGALNYNWLDTGGGPAGTGSSLDVNTPGTYTLIVTNVGNGCTDETSIDVEEDSDFPNPDAFADGILTCVNETVLIDGSNSTTSGTISFNWLDSGGESVGSNPTLNVTDPDTYTLVITDLDNGCTAEVSVIVDQDIAQPTSDAGQGATLTCGANTVSLDGSGSSSGNNISYLWQNAGGVPVGTTPMVDVSQTGIYTLIITNVDNGCTDASTVEVVPDAALPTANAGAGATLTCVVTDVNLNGGGSSSGSNIGYEWFDPNNTPLGGNLIINVTNIGTYTLVVTDTDNGCSASSSVEVIENVTPPIADAGQNSSVSCLITDATLDGSGSDSGPNISYVWENSLNEIVGNSAIIVVDEVGVYTLIVTNNDTGCSSTASAEITSSVVLPTADAGNTDLLTCSITQVTLDGSGSSSGNNIDYEWLDPSGNTISTTITATANVPGTYTIIVTDADNGCVSEAQVVVDEDVAAPTAFINTGSSTGLDCNVTSTVLDGTGSSPANSLTFLWTTVDGNIISGATTPNPEVDAEGTYLLTVINTINGCTASETIFIDQDITPPVAFINNPDELTCVVVETTLDGTGSSDNGNFSYLWSNPNGGIVSGETTLQPMINLPGVYTLVVLDGDNGCETSTNITVIENIDLPNAVATTDEGFNCVTESVTLSGNGSSVGPEFSYIWTGGNVIDDNTSLAPTIYEPGTYTLLVNNNENGCSQSADVFVDEEGNIPTAALIDVTDAPCFGYPGNLIVAEVTGGQTPYLYSVDGGQNFSSSNIFNSLEPGDYTVIIQDAIGCEHEEEVYIAPAPELTVNLGPEITIELGRDYQINGFANIPMSEIDTIIWSPTAGLSCLDCLNPFVDTLLNEIEYRVTIINQNGCEATDRIMLRVDKIREVFIPNAFSPHNNDGQNDKFMIFANNDKIKQINSFQVYDRWGELVFQDFNFQPNNPAHGWDGALKDEPMNPAVFVYWAEIEFIDGAVILYKGNVTLLK